MQFNTLTDLRDLSGVRVLLRLDLNVPMKDGKITDLSRIQETLPTIQELLKKGAKVIILSHLGRPNGTPNDQYTLRPVAAALMKALNNHPVFFCEDTIGAHAETLTEILKPGEIGMMENLRFHPGEEDNDPQFAEALSKLGDIYVNDAFSACHRAHASIVGLPKLLPAYGGRLLEQELTHLEKYLEHPKEPSMAIVGGAKISTKLGLLKTLSAHVNSIAIVGGMANTFLKAQGNTIGTSLVENNMIEEATNILQEMDKNNCTCILPQDVVIATSPEDGANATTIPLKAMPGDKMILDVGPETLTVLQERLARSKTVMWNGSLGVNEFKPFDQGTCFLARFISERTQKGQLISIAGGGDTVAALNQTGVMGTFSYVSLAGGAFLEWLEGLKLPGLKALEDAKMYT